ncbi:type II secretion system GspH family protein [Kineosporia rhizophila]|uniref:type IV pilus modification PilV family protein n=1 Tax=Kineosporia rhizophila TaxID=84633 RepID=UPI001E3A3C14|nr:type II secretion system protein [Kineosporia rhizophila]MCE0539957.1 type II secretion system GspH family protein [Kineosporia rhizophila]
MGISLLEVVIAMAIFSIGVTAVLGIFINSSRVAGDNIRRTAAASLVNEKLEAARGQTAQQITNGREVTTRQVGDITYTITQNASYLTSNATGNVCQSSGSALAYKLVRVAVTWPDMGTVQPVTGDVLRAVGIGPTDGTKATLAVLITGATGLPVSGVTATLTGTTQSQVTGDDGCVVFAGLTDGSYSVSLNQTGYVGTANTTTARTQTLSVATGVVTRATLLYDSARTLNFALSAPVSTYVVPTGLPIRIGNTYLSETTVSATCSSSSASACLTGVPGQIRNLFPESYVVKAGSCTGTDVSQALVDIRRASANNSSVTLPMGAVTVNVERNNKKAANDRAVTFTLASGSSCGTSESYSVNTVSGTTTVLLPYGSWLVSTSFNLLNLGVGTASQTVTLNSSSRVATVTLTVAQ